MIVIDPLQKRTWAEVDLSAARHNYETVRRATLPSAAICCVVKANGYGHGATELSRLYERLGADMLAVSNVEEALELRRDGISLPILILGYTSPKCAASLAENRISQCVYSSEYAKNLSRCAQEAGVEIPVHIKIDTGMGRLGLRSQDSLEDAVAEAAEIASLPSLVPEGIFTHFATADEGDEGRDYVKLQFDRFLNLTDRLAERGIRFRFRHCANSAAIFDYPETHLDMVRAGIVLYGVLPSKKLHAAPELIPVMSFKTLVDHVKTIEAGESISYGRSFVAPRRMRVATLPVGYADGFRRCDKPSAVLLEHGSQTDRVFVVGRICMDQMMVDVSEVSGVDIGDEVVLFGRGTAPHVSELAARCGTIPYEILCGVGERVPRIYIPAEEEDREGDR